MRKPLFKTLTRFFFSFFFLDIDNDSPPRNIGPLIRNGVPEALRHLVKLRTYVSRYISLCLCLCLSLSYMSSATAAAAAAAAAAADDFPFLPFVSK